MINCIFCNKLFDNKRSSYDFFHQCKGYFIFYVDKMTNYFKHYDDNNLNIYSLYTYKSYNKSDMVEFTYISGSKYVSKIELLVKDCQDIDVCQKLFHDLISNHHLY